MRGRNRAARLVLLPALLALVVALAAGCGSSDTYSPTVPGGSLNTGLCGGASDRMDCGGMKHT